VTRHPALGDLIGMFRHAFGPVLRKLAPRAV
jgi:hypothetical protein